MIRTILDLIKKEMTEEEMTEEEKIKKERKKKIKELKNYFILLKDDSSDTNKTLVNSTNRIEPINDGEEPQRDDSADSNNDPLFTTGKSTNMEELKNEPCEVIATNCNQDTQPNLSKTFEDPSGVPKEFWQIHLN